MLGIELWSPVVLDQPVEALGSRCSGHLLPDGWECRLAQLTLQPPHSSGHCLLVALSQATASQAVPHPKMLFNCRCSTSYAIGLCICRCITDV